MVCPFTIPVILGCNVYEQKCQLHKIKQDKESILGPVGTKQSVCSLGVLECSLIAPLTYRSLITLEVNLSQKDKD